jgi:hypothetical protein
VPASCAPQIVEDCAAHGECNWGAFPVGAADSWAQILGLAPSASEAPLSNAATVSCADPTPLAEQCRVPVGKIVTEYYREGLILDGSYWTCLELWDAPEEPAPATRAQCTHEVTTCVARTRKACAAAGLSRVE